MLDNYSLPYVILVFFYIILSIIEHRKILCKTKIRVISGMIYFLFFGFSGFIGSDWVNYRDLYYNFELYSNLSNSYEAGFLLLVKLFSNIGLSFIVFKASLIFLQVLIFDKLISKYSPNIALSYAILIASFGIVIIDLLRNFSSILIASLSIPFFIERKYFKAITLCLLATTFHITAFMYVLIFFICTKNISTNKLIVVFVLGLIVYVFQIHYIKPLISAFGHLLGGRIGYLAVMYTESAVQNVNGSTYGIRIGILEKIFFMVVFLYNRKYIVTSNKNMKFIANLFIFYILTYLYMSEMETLINRFSVLFMFGYIIIVTKSIFTLRLKSNFRIIYLIVILLILSKTYSSFNNVLYNYNNVIWVEDNIDDRILNRSYYYLNRY